MRPPVFKDETEDVRLQQPSALVHRNPIESSNVTIKAPTPQTASHTGARTKFLFSSDREDEDNGKTDQPNHWEPDLDEPLVKTEEPDIHSEGPATPAPEPTEPAPKRKRGRPRKGEQTAKNLVVTRRSLRIVAHPTRGKPARNTAQVVAAKPLQAMGLALLLRAPRPTPLEESLLFGVLATGKQKPMTIDAERAYTASTRDRRFNLTTLDVIKQLVEEHVPRPVANDAVNENVVLTEFKAHLKYHIEHLMDLHWSIIDISHDISSIQRRKNELRRSILDLKKKHAQVGTELAIERKTYADAKAQHTKFVSMSESMLRLKTAILQEPPRHSSDHVLLQLRDLGALYHPERGLHGSLKSVNEQISSRLRAYNTEQ